MTEQQAIKRLKSEMEWESIELNREAFSMGIKALKEIQQYRAIGTPTQILEKIGGLDVELGKYACIGTVTELQALKEKSVAKKPIDISAVRDCDGYIGHIGKCPCCEDIVEEGTLYCDCGQHLDWE